MSWKRFCSVAILLCMLMTMFGPAAAQAATVAPKATEKLSKPMVGIDVSSWNEEIDWAKVKAAGVEFAIVRIFHHIKNTPNYELDEQFERNVREAQKYGIALGGYFFSYAQTLDAIAGEAQMVIEELNKYPGVFSFPIVFDAEDGDTTDDPNVSGNDIYDIGSFAGSAAKKFCNILAENGYYPMVYSYSWYFENNIGMSNVKDFDLWLASYPKSNGTQIYAGTGPADADEVNPNKREKLSSYDDNVTMWQYTGAGKIDGIYAGDGGAIVDLNLCYVDYPSIIKNGGYNGYEKGTNSFTTKPLVYRTGANGPAATYKSSKYYDHVTSIGLTGDGVTDTLAVALSQLGYYEGTSSNPYGGLYNTWDDYTSNKTTEYVYNYGDADSSGYKMAWCASFCSWAIYQSQTADHATHDESCRENMWDEEYIWRECSCYQWADQLKRFDLYSARGTYTPKAGDLIFFKMDGGGTAWTNHIGLVLYCDGTRVYTVEGNRHNHVLLTDYLLTDSQICGYGKLPYPTNDKAPKVDYSGQNKTAGQYITNDVTLSVSNTKGGAAAFTVGKYEMFDVTGFDGAYALVSYKGNTGYATLNANTIQVTATKSTYLANSMDASVDASSVADTSFAAGEVIPSENNNDRNPSILVTGLREDSNSYKGLENYGSNKEKILINGRTWDKWESRSGAKILNNIWIHGTGDGNAYLGIDIADTSRLRVQGTSGLGEEIETIVIKRGFEIVKTTSDLWDSGEISTGGSGVGGVVGYFKENVILVANDDGGFDVICGGSSDLGLEGYTFQTTKPQLVKLTADANIRSGPDASYAALGVGLEGDTFEYLDELQNTKWLKVDYKGQVAWISNVNASVIDVPQTVTLTADANIRSGPATTYESLGVGLAGDTFAYLNEIQNSKWLKVRYNGQEGWISNVNATLSEVDPVVIINANNQDWDETTYTVTFRNWNGDVLSTQTYRLGEEVIAPPDPTRPADSEYTYIFAGWDEPVVACDGDATYTAQFTRRRNDGILYTIEGGQVTVTGYMGGSSTLVIPATIENLPVTKLQGNAFLGCSGLNTLIFSGNAPVFADNAFAQLNIAAYYPANNSTWTDEKLQAFCGSVSWSSYCMIEGGQPGHYWQNATCTSPKTCENCAATMGDALNHKFENGSCIRCPAASVMITEQPGNASAYSGQNVKVTVGATGDGLSYKWYYKNAGAKKFSLTTSFTGNTYALSMNATRSGRQIYCVVTDRYGNSVQSDTVTISMRNSLSVAQLPVAMTFAEGSAAKVTVNATGDGLTYQWYFKNAGAKKFSLTDSFKGATYSVAMNATRNGRQIYCVVTDQYGTSVQTNTVTLSMQTTLAVTTQPKTTYTKLGSMAKVKITATGDGLTYQWYVKNSGSEKWVKSSITTDTYSIKMATVSKNRQIYCVVTDKYGNTVKTDTAYLRLAATVTAQPETSYTQRGATASVSVRASGDGLKYTWYVKNAGSSKWVESVVTGSTYSVKMAAASKDRQLYCVVTDKYGNTVETNKVYLRMAATVTAQPKTTYTKQGATAKTSITAVGDGLKYQWYVKNAGATKWSKSSITTNTYSVKMSATTRDRQVYCVVTDKYGKTVQTETVYLRMAATITKQPTSVTVAKGSVAKTSVTAVGDSLTYTWYVKNSGATKWTKSSITKSSYSITMSVAADGRQIYCVITDKYGNTVKTNTVTLKGK